MTAACSCGSPSPSSPSASSTPWASCSQNSCVPHPSPVSAARSARAAARYSSSTSSKPPCWRSPGRPRASCSGPWDSPACVPCTPTAPEITARQRISIRTASSGRWRWLPCLPSWRAFILPGGSGVSPPPYISRVNEHHRQRATMNLPIRPLLSALRRSPTGALLVTLQVAITLAVLVNASFLVSQRIAQIEQATGLDTRNTFGMIIGGTSNRFDVASAESEDLAYLRGLPGVVAATVTMGIPLTGEGSWNTTLWPQPGQRGAGVSANVMSGDGQALLSTLDV